MVKKTKTKTKNNKNNINNNKTKRTRNSNLSNKIKTEKNQNIFTSKKTIIIALVIMILTVLIAGIMCYVKEDEKMNVVILETNKGNIKIELKPEEALITVKNFLEYVERGHYEGLIFHRVIPGFMIQGGGFTPDGQQKETMNPIKLESNNGLKNEKGTIAMARTNIPDSATSQFFINVADNDFLNYAPGNPGYAVFGKVIEGMDVVTEIEKVKTANKQGHGDWPIEDVIIIKAYKE